MKNIPLKSLVIFISALIILIGCMPLSAFAEPEEEALGDIITVKTESALFREIEDAQTNDTIKLAKNINISECLKIASGKKLILDLAGKTIDRGLKTCTEDGSVIIVEKGATLTVKDSTNENKGVITGGASYNGGGISNFGTLTVTGATICNCIASNNGGGIYNAPSATLTLNGGVIKENKAENGAGIFNSEKSNLNFICGSYKVKELSKLKTYYTNASITNNTASEKGSGIYNCAVLNMEDSPNISGNSKGDDIYLEKGRTIRFTEAIDVKDKIGITMQDSDAAFTSNYSKYQTKTPSTFFKTNDSSKIVKLTSDRSEAILRGGKKTLVEAYDDGEELKDLIAYEEFDSPQDAWNRASALAKSGSFSKEGNKVEITLGSDWTHDKELVLKDYTNIIIDLNGHYIKRNRNRKPIENGGIFRLKLGARLTVNDSNPDSNGYDGIKGGVITGGASSNSGGAVTLEYASGLRMTGGTIYDCISTNNGGGICCEPGTEFVSMENSAINYCQALDGADGGGIYAERLSKLSIHDCVIRDCYSEESGGAIYSEGGHNCLFMLGRNVISGNKCEDDGGALWLSFAGNEGGHADSCIFSGNKAAGDGGAVFVEKNSNKYMEEKAEGILFRESLFSGNECGGDGSAIFVNRDNVVLVSSTVTKNKAGDTGAVFLSHRAAVAGYDISVKGSVVIRDNTAKDSAHKDLVLQNFGVTHNYVYCAGLYDDAYISISVCESGKVKIIKNVNEYQLTFFHPENGKLRFEKEKDVEATLVTASVFGKGKYAIILIPLAAALIAAAAVIHKKKKGAADNDAE